MKIITLFLISLQLYANSFAADSVVVSSPDKRIHVTVDYKGKLSYTISYENEFILQPSFIDLTLKNGQSLSNDLGVLKKSIASFNETIISPVPEKRKEIKNNYNQLTLQFKQPYTLLFRVYDDGVAYRVITRIKDSIFIKNEIAQYNFNANEKVLLAMVEPRKDVDRYHTSFEGTYQLKEMDSLTPEAIAYSPVLIGTGKEIKIAITESDLYDYPGMFLSGTKSNSLQGVFAPYPLQEKMTGDEFPQLLVTQRADKDLPGNDLVYRLGEPSKLKRCFMDTSRQRNG